MGGRGPKFKFGRNSPCPCGSGKKFKNCCAGKVDWHQLFQSGEDPTPYLTIRGRNLMFLGAIADVLQLDSENALSPGKDYRKAITASAVQKLHEAVIKLWPTNTDISTVLMRRRGEVSGLYVGLYDGLNSVLRGLARHSLYSNRVIVIDPFLYPPAVREQFNPLVEPEQHRVQTLKNVNFWLTLMPWIQAGIVEIIRTPGDFDPKLQWESFQRQRRKFEGNKVLQDALERTAREVGGTHKKQELFYDLVLLSPNHHLRKVFEESGAAEKDGMTAEQFIAYVERMRADHPDFIAPLGPDGLTGQIRHITSGANYEMAAITANLTGSYLATDLYSRWKEIELDREQHNATNREWAPFAKAFQEAELKYLDNIELGNALSLRKDGYLESLRAFLRRAWKSACSPEPFSEANAQLLADELTTEIRHAEEEWKEIDRKLVRWFGAELANTGTIWLSGHGLFAAAAIATTGSLSIATARSERRGFQRKFPAAFFLQKK